jgi:hypothetical protein
MSGHNEKRRLGKSESDTFEPVIHHTPDLPAIDFGAVGQQAPVLLDTPHDDLPQADAVVITWASAEWVAMQHVFCAGGSAMPYSDRDQSSWSGWQTYDRDMPKGAPSDWTYWGKTRLVKIGGQSVLLFKSNTHLDWPGESYLEQLIERIAQYVKPRLILSIGTAGGAETKDHVGTVRAVSAGTLDTGSGKWPVYSNKWPADWKVIEKSAFKKLLFPIPTTQSDLESLCKQVNQYYDYKPPYTLSQLNPGDLNMGSASPELVNATGGKTSLLTTSTFVVGTTAGTYGQYAVIEMDDAVIGKVCNEKHIPFGFVRNVSDPVQNADLPSDVQGNWGSAIYDSYGLYTSYNGALAAWAVLAGQLG